METTFLVSKFPLTNTTVNSVTYTAGITVPSLTLSTGAFFETTKPQMRLMRLMLEDQVPPREQGLALNTNTSKHLLNI